MKTRKLKHDRLSDENKSEYSVPSYHSAPGYNADKSAKNWRIFGYVSIGGVVLCVSIMAGIAESFIIGLIVFGGCILVTMLCFLLGGNYGMGAGARDEFLHEVKKDFGIKSNYERPKPVEVYGCPGCKKKLKEHQIIENTDGEGFCPKCNSRIYDPGDERFYTCEKCNEFFSEYDAFWKDKYDGPYCRNCKSDELLSDYDSY